MKPMLALAGFAVVLGIGVLVLRPGPKSEHLAPTAPPSIGSERPPSPAPTQTKRTPVAKATRSDDDRAAARLVARRQAGDAFTRRMREVDLDIRVTTHGRGHTILRLSGPTCGTQELAAFVRESAERLRDMGFERLECRGRFERADMAL